MPFIDLSHPLENGMPSFRIIQIHPFITHDQAEFESTLPTSIGTYLDSPYHRHHDRRNISQFEFSATTNLTDKPYCQNNKYDQAPFGKWNQSRAPQWEHLARFCRPIKVQRGCGYARSGLCRNS